jgi:LL-diaminopimelate aminotransferase
MTVATRLQHINEYYFSQKLREIDGMNKAGNTVINLGIGSPDLPPHPDVIAVLQTESSKPNVHAYQGYKGSPVLRTAIADWYQQWYGVQLDADTEILPLAGSKEGILHICMTYINEGDKVLIPNPGYPAYRSAVQLAGGACIEYDLTEAQNWFADLALLESTMDLAAVKLMFVNYPHMPSGQLPTREMFEALVAFAKRHDILLVHDNPYSFILNEQPLSLLSVPGAKDVVLELNSLSKSQNMAGWRIGMLNGRADRINEVLRFKSNMDSGMFLPVQLAAAKALGLGKDWYEQLNAIYKERRQKVFELLDVLGCTYNQAQAGMFVWAKVPAPYADGYALSDTVLYGYHVFITPGGIFGSNGNGYIRVSLCAPVERFDAAIAKLKQPSLIQTEQKQQV